MGGQGHKRARKELTGEARFRGLSVPNAKRAKQEVEEGQKKKQNEDKKNLPTAMSVGNDVKKKPDPKTMINDDQEQAPQFHLETNVPPPPPPTTTGLEALDVGQSIPGGGRKVIIILEEACFDVVKAKNGNFELLNCDDHLNLHQKLKRDPAHSRPDIAHQMLLCALDSPLNKVGLLTIYLRSAQGVLIEISPELRIPRTYKRFAGLMVQLLHKLRIRAKEGSKTLLRVIKNPVTQYLPPNTRKFSTSVKGTLVDVHEFVSHLDCEETPVAFVFGAMAAGKIAPDYVETCLSFSEFPMSGAYALGRLLDSNHVYEPSDDSYLFVDVLHAFAPWLMSCGAAVCMELGGGSGVLSGTVMGYDTGFQLVTDLNPQACLTCKETMRLNSQVKTKNHGWDIVQADLVSCMRLDGMVDMLLFNPPYVPTPDEEVGVSIGIEAAWAGGERGRVVLDRLLPCLNKLMAANSVVFLLLVEENDPDEIVAMLSSIEGGGFKSRIAGARKAQNERLMVVVSWRGVPDPPVI